MGELKTAAAYIRVSTDRQEELSPDAQRRELENYAKNHGIIITDYYQDTGISGRDAEKRPEFQKMIAAAKSQEHPYDCILLWKFSRFARNQEESIVYKSLLRKNNVDVVSITEPLIDGPFSSLIERIIEWMDEYYSIRLASDVMRGMKEKALRGGYNAAPPLGYRFNEKHIPEIFEPEAEIVRFIFQKCLEGYNTTTIARMLNDSNYRTKRGNQFETRTVLYVLKNPFYIGKIRWNRAVHGKYHNNPEEEIIISDGQHEQIIKSDDFEKVQNILKSHYPEVTRRRRKSDTEFKHYLCGLIKCQTCGHNLSYHSGGWQNNGKSIQPYFQCWRYQKGFHHGSNYVAASVCDTAVIDSIRSLLDDEKDIHIKKKVTAAKSPIELNRYRNALDKISVKESRIKDAYVNGIDSLEEYRENKSYLEQEKKKLIQLISDEEKKLDMEEMLSNLDSRNILAEVLAMLQNPHVRPFEKHNALEKVLDKVVYTRETDSFEFYYKL